MEKKKFCLFISRALAIVFFVSSFFSFMTVNYYYIFAHVDSFSPGIIILNWLKISALVVIPLGLFFNRPRWKNVIKLFYFFVGLFLLFFVDEYCSIVKVAATSQEEIYNTINLFLSPLSIRILYILESCLLMMISILSWVESNLDFKELKYIYKFLFVIILIAPLNIFDNLVRLFPESIYSFFKFKNFSIWHIISLILLFLSTIIIYLFLRNKERKDQEYYLQVLAIITMVQYSSKMSIIMGDGYNVYHTIFACIPLFICNIGIFVAFLAMFLKRKVLYSIAFFVHAVGALTVFIYFGRDDMSNFGTIFNFSFLFFCLTHLLLFNLCVMPVLLKHFTFKIKYCIIPLIYYGVVIIVASVSSVLVSNYSMTFVDSAFNHLSEPIYPNYAFTQINPLPVEVPTMLNFEVGFCEVNPIYILLVYIAYILLFFSFYFIQKLLAFIFTKTKSKCSILHE